MREMRPIDSPTLRRLLERADSYPVIAAAAESGALAALLPVRLFDHIETIYRRLERVAPPGCAEVAALRLAVLVHEEPPAALPVLLAAAGFPDFAPTIVGVVGGFGALWKLTTAAAFAAFVTTHRGHLAALLLFELVHEGEPIPAMAHIAALAGLASDFASWVARLRTPSTTP